MAEHRTTAQMANEHQPIKQYATISMGIEVEIETETETKKDIHILRYQIV